MLIKHSPSHLHWIPLACRSKVCLLCLLPWTTFMCVVTSRRVFKSGDGLHAAIGAGRITNTGLRPSCCAVWKLWQETCRSAFRRRISDSKTVQLNSCMFVQLISLLRGTQDLHLHDEFKEVQLHYCNRKSLKRRFPVWRQRPIVWPADMFSVVNVVFVSDRFMSKPAKPSYLCMIVSCTSVNRGTVWILWTRWRHLFLLSLDLLIRTSNPCACIRAALLNIWDYYFKASDSCRTVLLP